MIRPAPADIPAAQRLDLRKVPCDDVVDRVETCLRLRLAVDGAVRKRRTLGLRSDRGTWVRIECRGLERLDGQGWGLEAAGLLDGVPAPDWYAGMSWFDADRRVVWRADEVQLIETAPIRRAASATSLTDPWWTALDTALDALAAHPTTRLATPDCQPITAERIETTIRKIFPHATGLTTTEWATAHADFTFANLTAPTLWILDWEDWGRAPRGTDAASLWFSSLAIPEIADRIRRNRSPELNTPTGHTMMLFKCAQLLTWAHDNEPLHTPATNEAHRLLHELAA